MTILLHNHLFKNAGTTIDAVLRRTFGRGFVDHRDDDEMIRGSAYLVPYFSSNPWIRAVTTHHFRPPLPRIEGVHVMTLMMLRCPFARATSVYDFERRRPDAVSQMSLLARRVSLREFVLWGIRPDVSSTLANFHVLRSLPSCFNSHSEIGDGEYAEALRYVETVPLLGFVDRFDESMVLFEHSLRDFLPAIDLSYVKENVGPRSFLTSGERMEALRREIGDDAIQSLSQSNRYDLALLAFARELFDRRLSAVEGLEEKLAAFRERCTVRAARRVSARSMDFFLRYFSFRRTGFPKRG